MTPLKIVFAGTPAFGLPCLETLAKKHHIIAIYTQPDRPAGRGRHPQASAIKTWGLDHNIPIYQPLNFKEESSVAELQALQADVMVVIAYGLILPQRVLSIPLLGCINVHASLLPAWRGAAPIQYALLHGDKISGITIMQMDVGMDTGDILTQVSCPIHPEDTAQSLEETLSTLAVTPLLNTLESLVLREHKPQKQDNSLATYAKKIHKDHAKIIWTKPAEEIARQVRAFHPWPIAFAQTEKETIRIYKGQVIPTASTVPPGTLIHLDKEGILVATGFQNFLIQSLQFPGGKVLTVADWMNAQRKSLYPGLVFQ